MMIKDHVSILGTDYRIVCKKHSAKMFVRNDASGLCDSWSKTIYYSDLGDLRRNNKVKIQKQILRHEIIHAYLSESGLDENSLVPGDAWPINEEMVQWIAVMFPKIMNTFLELGIGD